MEQLNSGYRHSVSRPPARVSFLTACGYAHWSTICVLAYIDSRYKEYISSTYNEQKDEYEAKLYVSRYDGGREQGFVFTLKYKDHQANYAVFNPCLYDALCVMHDEKVTDRPDGWGDRPWDKHQIHDKEFDYEECIFCAKYILRQFRWHIEKWNKSQTE